MFLAKVKQCITSTCKHPVYAKKCVFIVQPVLPDGSEQGDEWVAVDYVGAGYGDTVICGSSPGAAKLLFSADRAPIRTLILGIVDRIECNGR